MEPVLISSLVLREGSQHSDSLRVALESGTSGEQLEKRGFR